MKIAAWRTHALVTTADQLMQRRALADEGAIFSEANSPKSSPGQDHNVVKAMFREFERQKERRGGAGRK